MKTAEIVVRILEDEGITAAFGIPGAAINPVYQYLKSSTIKHYIARHEEGAVHAADGDCRASGRMALAICCVTDPADIAGVMREAFRTARSGRPDPVLVDLPLDVQMADVGYRPDEDGPLPWS